MIIELAGLPGSGKTTIARRLAAADPTIRSRVVAPWWLGILHHPVWTLSESFRREAIGPGTGWPAWTTFRLLARAQLGIRPGPGRVELLEEGVTHHLWRTLFLHPALERAPWRELLSLPHPLLILDADRATRFARVAGKAGKGKVNRQLAEEPIDGERWNRADQLFEAIVAAVPPDRPVVRVATSGSIDEAVARVRGEIGMFG